jgi:hypothetical protein
MKPCHSSYCECDPGHCTHPGFRDARHEPIIAPATAIATATTDKHDLVIDMLNDLGDQVSLSKEATATVNVNKVVGSNLTTVTLTVVLKD